MKTQFKLIKPVLAALLVTGLSGIAQAAYFEQVGFIGSGGYSALTNGNDVSDAALVSVLVPSGDVMLSGALLSSAVLPNGTLDHSYSAQAAVTFMTASTGLSLNLAQTLTANSTGGTLSVSSHQQDPFLDLISVNLKIVGQAGEADGAAVQVSFNGLANATYQVDNAISSSYLGLGLSVFQGDTVLGEYFWDVQQSGTQAVNFSFAGTVGQSYTLSSFMLTGATLANGAFLQASIPYALVDASANLNGSFTMAAAVPEPETYAMLLAGLGLLGLMRQRRTRQMTKKSPL